jgi:glutaredoxin
MNLSPRWLVRGAVVLAIVGVLGARKYVRHMQRIPHMAMDATTLAAAKTVNVTIYSAEWCHSCRDAEQFLDENGIPYQARDVDKDPAALARADVLNPRHTIPVIDIEGAVLSGYEPHQIEGALMKAAQRHLGAPASVQAGTAGGSPHS